MKLTSSSFGDQQVIPGDFAFCLPDPAHHVCLGRNLNPQLTWSDAPATTKSFAIICHDPDVPSKGDDVNQEGRSVPASLPRVDFFHWVLFDLPANLHEIKQGEFSKDVTPRGKPGPATLHDARHGINDYTGWFAGDNDMRGDYFGHYGPSAPLLLNVVHHYVFTIFALDLEHLALDGKVTGQQVREAMQGHILDQATLTGLYTLNPAVTV